MLNGENNFSFSLEYSLCYPRWPHHFPPPLPRLGSWFLIMQISTTFCSLIPTATHFLPKILFLISLSRLDCGCLHVARDNGSSKTSETTRQTTGCHRPEEQNLKFPSPRKPNSLTPPIAHTQNKIFRRHNYNIHDR